MVMLLVDAATGTAEAQRPVSTDDASRAQPQAAYQTSRLPTRVGITAQTSISLEDAIAKALASNTDIAVARVASEQATFDVAAARGVFDPTA
ncbi:MAG: hypothetical protein ACRD3C_16835 [Vicinamibacterales bacterium]